MITVTCLAPQYQKMLFVCTIKHCMYKNYLPLTARFPFSETSNLLVAGMRRTSNWTEPERSRKVKREDIDRGKIRWPLNWKSSSSSVLHNQRSPAPSLLCSHPCCPALTSLWQDGGPMDGDIFKGNRGDFHDNSQISHQGTPCQHQVTRCWVEDTPINAVSNQVVVCRLWA